MTFGIIPEYLGKLFPSDSSDHSAEEKISEHNNEEKKETVVNNEQNVSPISGTSTNRGNVKGKCLHLTSIWGEKHFRRRFVGREYFSLG